MKEGRESREVCAQRKGHSKHAAICTQRREASPETTSAGISTLLGLPRSPDLRQQRSVAQVSQSALPAGGPELSNKYPTEPQQPRSTFPGRLGHMIHV